MRSTRTMIGNILHMTSAEETRRQIDSHLAARDRASAVAAALDAVRTGGLPILDLYDGVLVPLLVDTGASWQAGTTNVWQEHFASATVRTIVEALYPDVTALATSAPPKGTTVLLACPPQEQHDLGLRMLTDRFALAGWNTIYLGTDTPTAEIVSAAAEVGADLVVLSASTHFNRVQLRTVVERIKAGLPGVRVAVGGPAFALDRDWPASELFDLAEIDAPASGA